MARDDYRIRVELPEEEHAAGLLSRLGLGSRVHELAEELEGRKLAVSQDPGRRRGSDRGKFSGGGCIPKAIRRWQVIQDSLPALPV